MSAPFFSILLPTKNRASILPYAVASLRDQTFADFEVILMDNDDTSATIQAFYDGMAYLLDERFKYRRTGGLWMSDNWEAALDEATGDYLYVMEDKALLYPKTLEILSATIEQTRARCIVFNQTAHSPLPEYDSCSEGSLPELKYPDGSNQVQFKEIRCDAVIDRFLTHGWQYLHDHGPRGINSVVERKLAEDIRVEAGRFYHNYCPDVTSDLLQLDRLETLIRLEVPLVSFGMHHSVSLGWKFRMSVPGAFDSLLNASGDQLAHLVRVPLGHLALLHNCLYADYLAVRDHAVGHLKDTSLSVEVYFRQVESDLVELERFGADVKRLRRYVETVRSRTGNAKL